MKKKQKHFFKYSDPEKITTGSLKSAKKEIKAHSQLIAEKDFKKVITTIIVFVLLIVIFILLDNQFDFGKYPPKI